METLTITRLDASSLPTNAEIVNMRYSTAELAFQYGTRKAATYANRGYDVKCIGIVEVEGKAEFDGMKLKFTDYKYVLLSNE